jgi:hypothetical protein
LTAYTRPATHLLDENTLLVVLSTGTYHIISSILTSPQLGPPLDSLELSLSAREAGLDFIHDDVAVRDRHRMLPKDTIELTKHTSGWASTGDFGGVYSWVSE